MYVLIIAVIVTLIAPLFYFVIKMARADSKGIDDLMYDLKQKTKGIENIGIIQGKLLDSSKLQNHQDKYIVLNEVRRVFKYLNEDEYWIEFIIANIASYDVGFSLKNVSVVINEVKIDCDISLLMEKVPEHQAPPYGNRYFDTRFYNQFVLGSSGQKFFKFQSRFRVDEKPIIFTDCDCIEIGLEIYQLDTSVNKFITIDAITFTANFKNVKYKVIQQVDDVIEWLGPSND